MDDRVDSIDSKLAIIATSAARRAGEYLLRSQDSVYRTRQNSRLDAQYNVDRQANHIIVQYLCGMTPSYGLQSEESGPIQGAEQCTWIIDPLDGSANYSRGFPIFGTVIGLYVKEKLTLGVIHLPVAQEMFIAVSGQGAFRNGTQIHVSSVGDLRRAFIHFGTFSSDSSAKSKRSLFVEGLESTVQRVRILGSSAVDFAYVSCGRADGLLMQPLHRWDEDVGRLMVAEADGCSTQVLVTGRSVLVASNAAAHASLVRMTRQIMDYHT